MIPNPSQPKLTPTGDFANGGTSATLALALTQPLTTLKTFGQFGQSFFADKKPNVQMIKRLYSGFFPSALSGALAEGVVFATYSQGKKHLQESEGKLSMRKNLALSCAAGALGSPANSALEQLMIRQQLYRGTIWSHVDKIYQSSGIRGLLKGSAVTAGRDMGFNIGVFGLNDAAKEQLQPYIANPLAHEVSSGLVSGAMAGFFTNPFDMVKTKMQGDLTGEHKTFIGTATKIIQNNGVKGLFPGAIARTGTIAALVCVTALLKERIPDLLPGFLKL